MKGPNEMQKEKHLDNAVLIYFIILIIVVIFNMIKNIDFLDIVYLVALLCSVLKYFLIVNEDRK
jgi:L-asparagine transporter-like permease